MGFYFFLMDAPGRVRSPFDVQRQGRAGAAELSIQNPADPGKCSMA